MADLLLELFSEEIPARMQDRARHDLARLVGALLDESQLDHGEVTTWSTPRRLGLRVRGLPESQPNTEVERKGPKVGAPDKALDGFLRSTGLTKDALEERTTPKGDFYFAVIRRDGRPTLDVLSENLPGLLESLPWPKSMRWGHHSLRWVRPLHSIVALLDQTVIPFSLGPVASGRSTQGHRFLSPDPITLSNVEGYFTALESAHVVLDPEAREARIDRGARAACEAAGLTLIADPALLREVTGLVEWPVPIVGAIDEAFMALPPEILSTSMRSHQKYFSVANPDGSMAPRFVVIANMETSDDGARIRAGNERVLRARLADAQFFWDTDAKRTLDSRVDDLAAIVFQAKFGEGADRVSHKVERLTAIAGAIAPRIDAPADDCARAARLAKADLVTGVVGEFPELQGKIGRYYALRDGESSAVADAIATHYSPAGPNDDCPTEPVSVAVALADKIDTLVGFFAIEEKPTGSKDPFALRRAALGILRIIVENTLRLPLGEVFQTALDGYPERLRARGDATIRSELLAFFADRLEVYLKDRGVRYDLIRAVIAAQPGGVPDDDLVRLLAKVEALQSFVETEAGTDLLAGYRRATSIVTIEEKKDGADYSSHPDANLLSEAPERELHAKLTATLPQIEERLAQESFTTAMAALAELREPIDRFFDEVTVNVDEAATRTNRLRLLSRIRSTLETVADFGRIEG